jgi:hypothetical protein
VGLRRDIAIVVTYRMLLNLAGLLLPLSTPMDASTWVSINYGALAIGGLIGYLSGFRAPQKIFMAMIPIFFIWYPYTMPLIMIGLGILDPLATPLIYEAYGDKALSLVYSLTSFSIAASGLFLLVPPFIPFMVLPFTLFLPSITRKVNVRQAVSSTLNMEIIIFASSTFILGGLYTIFLARVSGMPYSRYELAIAAASMGLMRLLSYKIKSWVYELIIMAGFGFMAFLLNAELFLLFILPYSMIYPVIAMVAGKRGGRDPTTAINAAFAGVGTGSAILPEASKYINALIFPIALIIMNGLMIMLNEVNHRLYLNRKYKSY